METCAAHGELVSEVRRQGYVLTQLHHAVCGDPADPKDMGMKGAIETLNRTLNGYSLADLKEKADRHDRMFVRGGRCVTWLTVTIAAAAIAAIIKSAVEKQEKPTYYGRPGYEAHTER